MTWYMKVIKFQRINFNFYQFYKKFLRELKEYEVKAVTRFGNPYFIH